jgi:hypothetical protein
MTDDPRPSRAAVFGLLALGLVFLGAVPLVILTNGVPPGYGFFEVIILPAVVGCLFTGRSLWRLIRRDHS